MYFTSPSVWNACRGFECFHFSLKWTVLMVWFWFETVNIASYETSILYTLYVIYVIWHDTLSIQLYCAHLKLSVLHCKEGRVKVFVFKKSYYALALWNIWPNKLLHLMFFFVNITKRCPSKNLAKFIKTLKINKLLALKH